MIWLAVPDPKLDRRYFIVRDYRGQPGASCAMVESEGSLRR